MNSFVFLFLACSDSEENYDIQVGGSEQSSDTSQVSEPSEEIIEEQTGEELYAQYCSACHGQDGTGGADAPGVINHLDDSDDKLVDIIINGFGRMAGIAVTEDEALRIIEYMRTEFGT